MNKFPRLCAQTYQNQPTQYFVALTTDKTKTKRFYLGPIRQARELYDALKTLYDSWGLSKAQIAQILASGAHKKGIRPLFKAAQQYINGQSTTPITTITPPEEGILLVDLFRRFIEENRVLWRVNDSGQQHNKLRYKRIIRDKLRDYQTYRVNEFNKAAFISWRGSLVAEGLKRETVNNYCNGLLYVFKWGVNHDLVPPELYNTLSLIPVLTPGETIAPESDPRTSVDRSVVERRYRRCVNPLRRLYNYCS